MSAFGYRVCSGCACDLPKSSFSQSQWSKRGVGLGARCRQCVEAGCSAGAAEERVRRSFSCTSGVLDKGNPFAAGTFRLVARGVFTDGNREGQLLVAKWFKFGLSKEASFFEADLRVGERARHLLAAFVAIGATSRSIRLNDAEIWTKPPREVVHTRGRLRKGPALVQYHDHPEGKKVMVEPFIEGFEKFNSNTGWTSATRVGTVDVLGALSHYSYHVSGGQYLLCDLQGSSNEHGIILSDPVIMSTSAGKFGPSDLGPLGIATFFSQHECGHHCSGAWQRPADTRQHLPVVSETSMTTGARGGGGGSGAHLGALQEDEEEEEEEEEDCYY